VGLEGKGVVVVGVGWRGDGSHYTIRDTTPDLMGRSLSSLHLYL
jgi:hypothetical protein